MLFLRKQSQEKVTPVEEPKKEVKLTKKQKLKQKKLKRKEKLLEKRCTLLKEHLARELKYGLYTYKKHEQNWIRMLTEISLPYHKERMEYIWQTFERLMDMKDFMISCLMDEMRQVEDQYMKGIITHVTKVDRIVGIFHGQLKELHENFISDYQSLRKENHICLWNMYKNSGASINHLKAMVYGMEMKDKERERTLRAELCSKVEYETYDNHGATAELTERLTLIFNSMIKNTNEVIEKFIKKTKKRRLDYDVFKVADDKAQEIIANETNKLQGLNELIRKLKKKEGDIGHNELSNLEGDKKFFQRAFLIMKMKLTDDLRLDKSKQEFFIAQFYDAYNSMSRFLKGGENMIRLMRSTKKLETSDEKCRPFPVYRQTLENVPEKKMYLFWQRIGKVDCSRTALAEERYSLLAENDLLRRKIRDICFCLSCPKLPPICRREGPIPFTDGVTLMRKYKLRDEKNRQ